MTRQIELIGGPGDGQIYIVAEDTWYLYLPEHPELVAAIEIMEPYEFKPFKTHRYEVSRLRREAYYRGTI